MRQFVLVEHEPRGTPRRFTFGQGTHLVGRSETCQIHIAEEDVSRRHANISVINGTIEVADLESRNGTYVDGRKIKSLTIVPGQIVRFGATSFMLKPLDPNVRTADPEETKSRRYADTPQGPDSAKVLTAAQKCVYEFLLRGFKDKEIAKKLKIEASTVHTHVREIFRKLHVHSRPELLARRLELKKSGQR